MSANPAIPPPPQNSPSTGAGFPFAEVCALFFGIFLFVMGLASQIPTLKFVAYAFPFMAGVFGIAASHVVYDICKPLFNTLAVGLLLAALTLDFAQPLSTGWQMRLSYLGLFLFALGLTGGFFRRRWWSAVREWDIPTRVAAIAIVLMWIVALGWVVAHAALH